MDYQHVVYGAARIIAEGVAVTGFYFAGRFLAGRYRPQWRNYLIVLLLAGTAGAIAGGMLRSHSGDFGFLTVRVSPSRNERIERGSTVFLALGLPGAIGVLLGRSGRR